MYLESDDKISTQPAGLDIAQDTPIGCIERRLAHPVQNPAPAFGRKRPVPVSDVAAKERGQGRLGDRIQRGIGRHGSMVLARYSFRRVSKQRPPSCRRSQRRAGVISTRLTGDISGPKITFFEAPGGDAMIGG